MDDECVEWLRSQRFIANPELGFFKDVGAQHFVNAWDNGYWLVGIDAATEQGIIVGKARSLQELQRLVDISMRAAQILTEAD